MSSVYWHGNGLPPQSSAWDLQPSSVQFPNHAPGKLTYIQGLVMHFRRLYLKYSQILSCQLPCASVRRVSELQRAPSKKPTTDDTLTSYSTSYITNDCLLHLLATWSYWKYTKKDCVLDLPKTQAGIPQGKNKKKIKGKIINLQSWVPLFSFSFFFSILCCCSLIWLSCPSGLITNCTMKSWRKGEHAWDQWTSNGAHQ